MKNYIRLILTGLISLAFASLSIAQELTEYNFILNNDESPFEIVVQDKQMVFEFKKQGDVLSIFIDKNKVNTKNLMAHVIFDQSEYIVYRTTQEDISTSEDGRIEIKMNLTKINEAIERSQSDKKTDTFHIQMKGKRIMKFKFKS